MGLFEQPVEDPQARRQRIAILVIAGIIVAVVGSYWLYYGYLHVPERLAAGHFLNAVAASNFPLAYQLWKADPEHYSYKDFLEDWGPQGYYGPVKSYRIESADSPRKSGTGIIVKVEVSPFAPFPAGDDVRSEQSKEIVLWVESKDRSLGFAP
jgi:hypothetical protein